MAAARTGRAGTPFDRPDIDLATDRSTPPGPAGRLRAPLDAAFETLPIGVLICTPDGDRANAELLRIARLDARRGLDGRGLDRRLRPVDVPASGAVGATPVRPVRAALGGEIWPAGRARLERGDGTVAVVRVSGLPLALGEGMGAVITVVDETAAHEAERLRDAFLGIVGHELRSPISSILGAAELLRDESLDRAVRAELAADLGDEARRLHELVEQLIRLADLRRAGETISAEPTHLAHLVRSGLARWRTRQPRLQIRIELPDGGVPPVLGEEGYVAQVLDTLLDNALKYAGGRSPITIRLERSGDEVGLHVLDEGPGFSTANARPVFGLFWRDVPTRGQPAPTPSGHGIGLFVARSIVEGLGGRIWATNRDEGGADVGFALPIARD